NFPAGATANDSIAHTAGHQDDPLVIVGNGKESSAGVITHSDAFTIANAGYSSAYDNLPYGGQTRMGSTYADNTIESWGNIKAADTIPTDDIGILLVKDSSGVYTIQLSVTNPDLSPHIFANGHASITASIKSGGSVGFVPGFITVSDLDITTPPASPTQPIFKVATYNLLGNLSNTYGFQFHVVAR
ncbi:MAG TPA: hypothetical protein VGM92_14990, partial [Candidatus Kapabacteria bacterium]